MIIISIMLNILLVLTILGLMKYYRNKPQCNFKNSCTKFNSQDIVSAAKRIVDLIVEEHQHQSLIRKELIKYIKSK